MFTDAEKSAALEARHRGGRLSGRQLRACREAGLELGNPLPVVDRPWDDASRRVLARLCRRGWSAEAIAEFLRRSEDSVRREIGRAGGSGP